MNDELNAADDNPGSGLQQTASKPKGESIRSDDRATSPAEVIIRDDEEAFAQEIANKEVEKVMDLIAVHRESLLPPAEEFNSYNDNAQKALLDVLDRQTKAIFDDESIRQDKLTDGEIKQSRMGQILSAVIIVVAIASSTVIALSGGSTVVAGIMMAFPFAAIIGNLFIPAKSKSSRGKDVK